MDARIDGAQLAGVRTLILVIEAGNLARAAKRLGLGPSSVSRQISRLEAALGVRLLSRTTRRLRPTPAGMDLYQRALPLFEALSVATRDVGERERAVAGWVRISSSPAFGRACLVPRLHALANEHPALRFDLVLTARRLDFVEDAIDLAVREGPLSDSSLVARRLPDANVVLCASPAYLRRAGQPKKVQDLGRHALLLLPTANVPVALRRRFPIEPRFRVDDLFALRELAEDGAGIAALPDYLVAKALASGALVPVLPKTTIATVPMHLVYPGRRLLSRRAEIVVDALCP